MPTIIKKLDPNSFQLKDQVVAINRVTKVVKGGKNMSFAALVVVGDPSAAVVGYGSGKPMRVALTELAPAAGVSVETERKAGVLAADLHFSDGLSLVDDHLSHCVREAIDAGGPQADAKVAEASAAIARLVRS